MGGGSPGLGVRAERIWFKRKPLFPARPWRAGRLDGGEHPALLWGTLLLGSHASHRARKVPTEHPELVLCGSHDVSIHAALRTERTPSGQFPYYSSVSRANKAHRSAGAELRPPPPGHRPGQSHRPLSAENHLRSAWSPARISTCPGSRASY